MYSVEINNNGLRKSIQDDKEKLTSGKVIKGINVIDSFQFSISPLNAGYEDIYSYTTLVSVRNDNLNSYEFHGRVLYSEDSMDENGYIRKDVICESFLGFFCDSQQEYVPEKNWTVGGLIQHIINCHNAQVEEYKQFYLGEITVTDPNDNIYCGIQYENTWETIKKKLIDVLGGEIRFRLIDGRLYLDYCVEFGEVKTTEIALAKNMKSVTREKDPSEIITRLIPLGAKKKAIDEEGKEYETEYRTDISSVNDGKNYIDDEEGTALYGIRVGVVYFDDVNVPGTLMKRGIDWLFNNNKVQIKYAITPLDLSLIGLDFDSFDIYNYYYVYNSLIGINDTIRVIKKTIDIVEEVKSTLEFGDSFETLSEALKRKSYEMSLATANYVTNTRFRSELNKTTTLIEQTEERIRLEVTGEYTELEGRVKETEASLELKIGRDENDQIVSMINASADIITLNSNRLIINSTNFTLTADGSVTATNAKIKSEEGGYSVEIGGGTVTIDGPWSAREEEQTMLLMQFHSVFGDLCGLYVCGYLDDSMQFQPTNVFASRIS